MTQQSQSAVARLSACRSLNRHPTATAVLPGVRHTPVQVALTSLPLPRLLAWDPASLPSPQTPLCWSPAQRTRTSRPGGSTLATATAPCLPTATQSWLSPLCPTRTTCSRRVRHGGVGRTQGGGGRGGQMCTAQDVRTPPVVCLCCRYTVLAALPLPVGLAWPPTKVPALSLRLSPTRCHPPAAATSPFCRQGPAGQVLGHGQVRAAADPGGPLR